ncbi:MAG: DUF1292 domain-containing protein [Deltaproteobacteria bacterium]|nr:DUF1292 domain-containing protein [Deltaproteobacteria bacterium]MBW2253830.1 DUF1292 domain-containing protein [Deltaproteobacteria bacterium]
MGQDPDNGQGHVDGLDESEIITDEDRVILIDEDGNEHPFVLLALLEVEGQDYAVLGPEDQLTDPSLEEVELSFFRVSPGSSEDEECFEAVEDDEEFEKVQAACADLLGLNEDED